MNILGFDPGKDKCGIALVGKNGLLLHHEVATAEEAMTILQALVEKFKPVVLVMGNQTTSQMWKSELELCLTVPIVMVDERNSTLEARDRYWVMYPPRGLTKLIPQGMRLPPRPVDDIVAILLIERYLAKIVP